MATPIANPTATYGNTMKTMVAMMRSGCGDRRRLRGERSRQRLQHVGVRALLPLERLLEAHDRRHETVADELLALFSRFESIEKPEHEAQVIRHLRRRDLDAGLAAALLQVRHERAPPALLAKEMVPEIE